VSPAGQIRTLVLVRPGSAARGTADTRHGPRVTYTVPWDSCLPKGFPAAIMCALPRPSRCFIADLPRGADPWLAILSGRVAGSSDVCGKIA
jgi:hypothetical protein